MVSKPSQTFDWLVRLLSKSSQICVNNLSPLLVLLVTGVVVASLLGKVGEHGGKGLPADRVRLVLLAHIPAHGRELSNRLTKWNQTSIMRYVKAYLQKSTIGVSLVSGKSKSDNILDILEKRHLLGKRSWKFSSVTMNSTLLTLSGFSLLPGRISSTTSLSRVRTVEATA